MTKLTICPDCDGQKLMHGHDCDCPRCEASGVVPLISQVGKSLRNDCWWVRFHPFGSEEHAKAFEESIQERVPAQKPVAWRYRRRGREEWSVTDYINPNIDFDVWEVEALGLLHAVREARGL